MIKLRKILDKAYEDINRLNLKKRCNQFSNLNGCCKWDYSLISSEEESEISDFLEKNIEIYEKVIENKKNESTCYFHDKINKKCLIEKVRPICCRYISYKIYEKEDCFKSCSPTNPCQKEKSTVISVSKEDVYVESEYIKYIILNNEKIYFIDDKSIPEYVEYKKNQNIKLSKVINK
ncbi:hypothetical protein H5J22_10590 [Cetobacterium sp. 8H]|uniref:hypothetical protein n=1 Tax=Cetobacterium sp. 8H TaxID=2759681 RepID=UPI00163C56FD|nr:hypothetical protein [Cetobacterium sp. 8H]MBC2851842.1 hypothetical protein [Cetobacterium sp. 8H]